MSPPAFRFLTGSHRVCQQVINHIAPVLVGIATVLAAAPCAVPIISGRFYCLSDAAVARRTIVSVTSDNYAGMHSRLFVKRYNADNSDAPLFDFFSFLNHLTFSFSDAVPPLARPLSRSRRRKHDGRWSHGSLTTDQWTFSRCPFP